MTALVTGASSGIGKEIAKKLSSKGIRLIITGRNLPALEKLKCSLGKNDTVIITADLSRREECLRLYEQVKPYDIDIFINNAGLGAFGKFTETSLERDLEIIDVNMTAMHILMKLFLKDFHKKNSGYILNIASIAGFLPGPYMATYYSSKNYVVRLTEAVYEELHSDKSKFYVVAFCPRPVATNFNAVANVKFSLKSIPAEYAAECAVKGMFSRKVIIIPTISMKAASIGAGLVSPLLLTKVTRYNQSMKGI